MWEARAEYADGTSIERLFRYDEHVNEGNQPKQARRGLSWIAKRR